MKRSIFSLILCLLIWPASAQLGGGLMFPGPGGVAGAPVSPATISFIGVSNGSGTGTSLTFTGISIGTAAANRCVVVAVGYRVTASATAVTGVTIGGSAATLVAAGAPNATTAVALASLVVTTGTTATIVVTFNNALTGSPTGGIGVYNIITSTGSCPGTGASATTITSGATMNVNIPTGGVGVGVGSDASSPTFTWTGLTRDFNTTPNQGYSGASLTFASAQTPLAVAASSSSNVAPNMVVAAWGP